MIDHIQKFLLALGQGFAFVGRQMPLEIGDDDFYLDLLFYHFKLRRFIVIELKARKFESGDGEQLGTYMTAVDRLLRPRILPNELQASLPSIEEIEAELAGDVDGAAN